MCANSLNTFKMLITKNFACEYTSETQMLDVTTQMICPGTGLRQFNAFQIQIHFWF